MADSRGIFNNLQHADEMKRALMNSGYHDGLVSKYKKGRGYLVIGKHCGQDSFDEIALQIEGRLG